MPLFEQEYFKVTSAIHCSTVYGKVIVDILYKKTNTESVTKRLLTSISVDIRIYQPSKSDILLSLWPRWIPRFRVDESLCQRKLKSILLVTSTENISSILNQ